MLKLSSEGNLKNARGSDSALYRMRKGLIPPGTVRERFARGVYRIVKWLGKKCFNIFCSLVESARQYAAGSTCRVFEPAKYDVFVFSVINWDFCFQRPQQIARKFAQGGHRVFYVSDKFTENKSVKVKKIENNLFELSLRGDAEINIRKQRPSASALRKMAISLYKFCLDNNCSTGILLVQSPFWGPLAEELRIRFGWPIVYDCMDDHWGFTTNGEPALIMEQWLLERADLTVVSSNLLEKKARASCANVALIRNAADYENFAPVVKNNTWLQRYDEMKSAIVSSVPKVSVIVVIHNNLELNKLCLSSILQKTDYPNYEVIIVDNNSTDGSREFALELSRSNSRIKVILNSENESFAKANNRAVVSCSGDYVVFLNNDTIVTRGWITRFLRHLKNDPNIGMIGPVSNAVGNEAKIDISYTSPGGIDGFARQYCRRHDGETFEIPVLALFCAVINRDLLENIGRLDECYDVGLFEDDDLCMRIKKAGFRLVCAEDVFIHHFQQGTFKLLPGDVYKQVFESNRKRFEEKWGPWKPHQQRKPAGATKTGPP